MKHTISIQDFQKDAPDWMTEEAVTTVYNSTNILNETPNKMYARLAKRAAFYYPQGIGNITQAGLESSFLMLLLNGFLSPATPVAYNFGTDGRGLPISCYANKPENSIKGIFDANTESALLSKHGGGLGVNLTEIVGASNVTTWMKTFDNTASSVSQGNTRRGHCAMYLNARHPNILAALNTIDTLSGDIRQKIANKVGIVFDREFLRQSKIKGTHERVVYARVLSLRVQYGFPYIQFQENAWDGDPQCYKDRGLKSGTSNLCTEIFLHHDALHTYVCCLSSLNLARYNEWADLVIDGYTAVELSIFFLDAIMEEFIQKASKIEGLEKAVRFSKKSRALGLGVLGYHSLLQSRMIPFDSNKAAKLNRNIFKKIQKEAINASKILAKQLGEPEWCEGSGRRNTHLIAVAPTMSNSVLCNAGSAGVEPMIGNYFVAKLGKTTRAKKNKYLEQLLIGLDKNTGSVWEKIRLDDGSVKNLDFLTEKQKAVFKTAYEIDPYSIIEQAGDRQKFICQGQSINLFFNSDAEAKLISDIHYEAEELGLKSLYYLRSDSLQQKLNQNSDIDYVFLYTRDDCTYCAQAKELLTEKGIPFQTEYKAEGRVPEIYIKGEKLSNGFASLQKRFFEASGVEVPEEDCVSCSG